MPILLILHHQPPVYLAVYLCRAAGKHCTRLHGSCGYGNFYAWKSWLLHLLSVSAGLSLNGGLLAALLTNLRGCGVNDVVSTRCLDLAIFSFSSLATYIQSCAAIQSDLLNSFDFRFHSLASMAQVAGCCKIQSALPQIGSSLQHVLQHYEASK